MLNSTALAVRPDDGSIPGTDPSDVADTSPAAGWVERGARVTTILLVGRLIAADVDHLCRVRNVSDGGIMIECHAAIDVGAQVRVELRHDIVIEAEVMWVGYPRLGVRALSPIDVRALLGTRRRTGRQVPRSPRVTAAAAVRLSCCGSAHAGTLLDISQAGCRIASAESRKFDEPVRITVAGLPPRTAVQRWIRDGQAGFVFIEPYSFVELSCWQKDHQSRFSGKRSDKSDQNSSNEQKFTINIDAS